KPYANLWHKIWINVLPQNILKRKLKYSGDPRASVGTVFPWMAPTRTSEPGSGQDTTPETAHPLQAYWSMPRRIRLDFSGVEAGVCDLCGESAENLVRRYRTKNYGVNYTGAWMHPLSPYNYGSREENPPLAVKGQRGGVGYRHWLGFTLGTAEKMPDASIAVRHFNRHILPEHEQEVQLWCFGYDLDNMKARCWHDCMLPVYSFADGERRRAFSEVVARLLAVAKDAAYQLNKSVKAARFKWPDDVDAGPAVPRSFWEASQALFYRLLEKAVHSDPFSAKAVAPIYKEWLKEVRRIAVELFDDWVLAAPIKKMNMRRVIEARVDLLKWLVKGEAAKSLWQFVHECNKEVA
ncbi:MAG: type I-E CRISPR-associated protein Cse1/CasA, partial [Acidobacteriaceae bacterium]|nr:type I-E CRISPR-associated protein Cse1/CasA [Acidobacteriaceae bacterium]